MFPPPAGRPTVNEGLPNLSLRRSGRETSAVDSDRPIRQTDNDAAEARLSAVTKGYLIDPYIAYFVPRAQFVPPRPPLINIGTRVRSEAIDILVNQWLELGGPELKKQIVSLGAGSDTRFWRLASGPLKERVVAYVEVDFPENTGRKAQIIWDTPGLRSVLNEEAKNGNALTSSVYHLRPLDLREPPERSLTQVMQDCGLSRDLPTLFLAECVFVYMNPSASDAVIRWFGDSFDIVGGIIYEMFGLNDSFGKVMKKNLKARHISLPGADAYPTLPSQESRFKNQSFTNAHAISLKTLRQLHIPDKEFSRESRFEFLDEVEELELVLDHYVVAWGSNDPPDSQLAVEWGFQPSN